MKKLLLLISICLIVCKTNAQQNDSLIFDKVNDLKMSQILHFTNLNQSHLYNKTLNWFSEFYKNSNEVIRAKIDTQMVKGTALVIGIVEWDAFAKGDLLYSIKFDFKDSMVRITYYDLIYDPTHTPISFYIYDKTGTLKNSKKSLRIYNSCNSYLKQITENYNSYILKQENSSW